MCTVVRNLCYIVCDNVSGKKQIKLSIDIQFTLCTTVIVGAQRKENNNDIPFHYNNKFCN